MILGGDEIRRTQQGNNNAYCQDNEIDWFDWKLAEKNRDIYRFFKQMIALRKSLPTLRRDHFFNGEINARGLADISWHGCRLYNPGWEDPSSTVLAFTIGGFPQQDSVEDRDIHVMLNMDWHDLNFDVPPLSNRQWYKSLIQRRIHRLISRKPPPTSQPEPDNPEHLPCKKSQHCCTHFTLAKEKKEIFHGYHAFHLC